MKQRRRKSSIDLLPDPVQSKIIELSKKHTLDQILEHLKEMDVDVSRSALGRHVQKIPEIIERMNRSRVVAEAIADKFGDKPDDKMARANIEMGHAIAMEVMSRCVVDPKTGEVSEQTFDPMQVMLIGKALDHFASAKKKDAEVTIKAREAAMQEAAKAVDKVGRELGLSSETVKSVRSAVLGISE